MLPELDFNAPAPLLQAKLEKYPPEQIAVLLEQIKDPEKRARVRSHLVTCYRRSKS